MADCKDQLSPIAQKIIGYMPPPNTPNSVSGSASNNYSPPNLRKDKFPVVSVRGDQNWNNSHHSFATLPSNGNLPRNANGLYSQHFTGFFFQDDWRATRRLTLNFGLRWDYERPVVERFNRLTDRFDPTVINPISGPAQAAYDAMLNDPANATNSGVLLLQQLLPSSKFQVPGAQLFPGVNGVPRTAAPLA